MFSKELGIAGTADCIAEYDGELAIIDFKTSKSLNHERIDTISYMLCICMYVI